MLLLFRGSLGLGFVPTNALAHQSSHLQSADPKADAFLRKQLLGRARPSRLPPVASQTSISSQARSTKTRQLKTSDEDDEDSRSGLGKAKGKNKSANTQATGSEVPGHADKHEIVHTNSTVAIQGDSEQSESPISPQPGKRATQNQKRGMSYLDELLAERAKKKQKKQKKGS